MSWRIVVISNRCKLDYSMNYMVVRGEETKRILLDEISLLMIENNAVSITGCLLSELVNKKIKVILCDDKRTPQAELVPYYGAHNDSLKIKQQMEWSLEIKKDVWTKIVKEKIRNQSIVLQKKGRIEEEATLLSYIDDVKNGDVTNREGHAAKVYFNALFGMKFTRNDEFDVRNAALNYGYAFLLSAFNREISANGYLTQLGLGHDNQFNHFNLSCDLMEPFRMIVDIEVANNSFKVFETEEKHIMAGILNNAVKINGMDQRLINAIKIYTKSVFDALNEENVELIKFIEL